MGNRELLRIREIFRVFFVVMVTSLYTLIKIPETVCLDMVSFNVCEVYFVKSE